MLPCRAVSGRMAEGKPRGVPGTALEGSGLGLGARSRLRSGDGILPAGSIDDEPSLSWAGFRFSIDPRQASHRLFNVRQVARHCLDLSVPLRASYRDPARLVAPLVEPWPPWACRTDRTMPGHGHRRHNAGIACRPNTS